MNTPEEAAHALAGQGRAPRADARRNRERVLEVASAVFATEGLSVPVQEIARRAGVGTGTVSRHFPTKESLFEAVFLSQVDRLVDKARVLMKTKEPGDAFFEFFVSVVEEGATNRGLVQALAGTGFDFDAATATSEHDFMGTLSTLLSRAKKSGAVRKEIDTMDVRALIVGCLARQPQPDDPKARSRVITVVRQGLRPCPPMMRRGKAAPDTVSERHRRGR